jgi:hypothetical protein
MSPGLLEAIETIQLWHGQLAVKHLHVYHAVSFENIEQLLLPLAKQETGMFWERPVDVTVNGLLNIFLAYGDLQECLEGAFRFPRLLHGSHPTCSPDKHQEE